MLFQILKIECAFVVVVAAVVYPLMVHWPNAIKTLVPVLFTAHDGRFLHAAPTVWVAVRLLLPGGENKEQVLRDLIHHPYLATIASGIILGLYCFRKPTGEIFLRVLGAFSVFSYIFGFNVFEQDMFYMLVPVLLLPTEFRGFNTALLVLSAAFMFPVCCALHDVAVIEMLVVVMTVLSLLIEYTANDEKEGEEGKQKFPAMAGGFKWMVLSVVLTIYVMFVNGSKYYRYVCTRTGPLDSLIYQAGFVLLLLFFGYSWIALSSATSDKKAIKQKTE